MAIDHAIADNHLDDDEFNRITELAKRFDMSASACPLPGRFIGLTRS